jgi:hypothetical protein
MLVKILGAIDVLSGLILILTILTEIPISLLIFFGVALLIKSLIGMLKDFGSWIDFLTGIVLVLCIFVQIPVFIKIIFGILIVQKGIASFL